jgi:hypothetical protein
MRGAVGVLGGDLARVKRCGGMIAGMITGRRVEVIIACLSVLLHRYPRYPPRINNMLGSVPRIQVTQLETE